MDRSMFNGLSIIVYIGIISTVLLFIVGIAFLFKVLVVPKTIKTHTKIIPEIQVEAIIKDGKVLTDTTYIYSK